MVQESDVFNLLQDLDVNKSPGPDGLHPKALKELAQTITKPWTKIFNLSLSTGKVPDVWNDIDRSMILTALSHLVLVSSLMIQSSIGRLVIRMMPHYCKKTWIYVIFLVSDLANVFNADKCKVLHFGLKNFSNGYNMNGSILSDVTFEKDLGVVNITGDLKPSRQCAAAAAKANRMLGLIKRNFSSFSKEIVLNLYKQLVRPHLDYAAQAWSPFHEKDKFLLEQVQRRASHLIPEVKHLPYHVRLTHLGLTTLELRRIREDMLQMYKFLSERNPLSSCNYLKVQSNSRVRGHCKKLVKCFARLDIRKFSFSHKSC
ncbi:hypothetical protein HOLleu_17308 [Holothuria leucospilota]|uniref:Uncharacterized protein n=1 Tax=Holothuria leucospilota TaxID=206669 RepID=A0A9Q1HBN5_HOLLE|nr:hypothetical protein HOLleu_17308 [Holothuria leucospilota]